MISRMSHATIFVLDQEKALEFYRDKLGFKVHTDAKMDGGFRWLTVTAPDAPDFEIILMEVKAGLMWDEETTNQVKALIEGGKMGAGGFNTADIQGTYEDLTKKGVEFLSPPADRPYAIEAIFKDNSGNWFSLSQEKDG